MNNTSIRLLVTVWLMAASVTGSMALDVEKIEIKHSDEMVYDGAKHTLSYLGSAHIVTDNMELKAERLILFFNEEENEVIKAEAYGNVYMKKDDFIAEAGAAVYETKTGKVVLNEKPVVYGTGKKLKANVIIYWLNERRVEAKGNVSGFYMPDKKTKSK